jgi:hypothetical protein
MCRSSLLYSLPLERVILFGVTLLVEPSWTWLVRLDHLRNGGKLTGCVSVLLAQMSSKSSYDTTRMNTVGQEALLAKFLCKLEGEQNVASLRLSVRKPFVISLAILSHQY